MWCIYDLLSVVAYVTPEGKSTRHAKLFFRQKQL